MNSSGVKTIYDGTKKLAESLRQLTEFEAAVGYPEDEKARQQGDPMTNAALAYIHNNGSPLANIPAREYMVKGVTAVQSQIAEVLKVGLVGLLDGGKTIDNSLNRAGLIAQTSIKNTLRAGEGFEPLKPATLRARARSGAKGTKPLIRTAQLLNGVTYIKRKRS